LKANEQQQDQKFDPQLQLCSAGLLCPTPVSRENQKRIFKSH